MIRQDLFQPIFLPIAQNCHLKIEKVGSSGYLLSVFFHFPPFYGSVIRNLVKVIGLFGINDRACTIMNCPSYR